MYHHFVEMSILLIVEVIDMSHFFTPKRIVILLILMIFGIILGRLVVRAVLNFMLGGTLFGGDFL